MTDQELQEYRDAVADCRCQEVGFCEAWGCEAVKELLDEIDRLKAAVRQEREECAALARGIAVEAGREALTCQSDDEQCHWNLGANTAAAEIEEAIWRRGEGQMP